MLRAYNNEAESIGRMMRAIHARIVHRSSENKSQTISKLGKTMRLPATDSYHVCRRNLSS